MLSVAMTTAETQTDLQGECEICQHLSPPVIRPLENTVLGPPLSDVRRQTADNRLSDASPLNSEHGRGTLTVRDTALPHTVARLLTCSSVVWPTE